MSRRGRSILLVLAMLAMAAPVAAQSELVIVKEGTKEYHRPGCPVIRDGKDVLAMTRAQAESRGYKAHPACDPANAPQPKAEAPVYVYVSPGDTRYHRETCSKLGSERQKVTVEEAVKTKHWPCTVCRPPLRKKSEPISPPRSGRG